MGLDLTYYPPMPPEMRPQPRLALTLGEMEARKWAMRSVCNRCRVILWVDIPILIKVMGPETFFWGRRGRCRAMSGLERCMGRTVYEARPPRSGAWYSLDDEVMTARHLWKVRAAKRGPETTKAPPAG